MQVFATSNQPQATSPNQSFEMSCSKIACRNPLCKNTAYVSAEGRKMPFCFTCFSEIKKQDLCTACFGPHGYHPQDQFICDKCFFGCQKCHGAKETPGRLPFCTRCYLQQRWEADVASGKCTSCHEAQATDPANKLYLCPACCDKKFPRECPECGHVKEIRRNELCKKCYFAREAAAHAPKPVHTIEECAEMRTSDKLRATGAPKKETRVPAAEFPVLGNVRVQVVEKTTWNVAPACVRDAPADDILLMAQPTKPLRPQSKKAIAAEPVRVVAAAPVFPKCSWADMVEEDDELPEIPAEWQPRVEIAEFSAQATFVVKKQH